MKYLAFTCLFVAFALSGGMLWSDRTNAETIGCITVNQVAGTHNWKFKNGCGARVDVAYCVRYVGDSSVRYLGNFQFNAGSSMTVHLHDRDHNMRFNYEETAVGQAATPGC